LLAASALAEDAAPSVDKLAQQLASKDLNTRREAAYQLSHLGTAAKPALPALLKALDDDDKQVWSSCIGAIAALGRTPWRRFPFDRPARQSQKSRPARRDVRQGSMRTAYALSRLGPRRAPAVDSGAWGKATSGLRIGAAGRCAAWAPRRRMPCLASSKPG